VGDDPFPIVWQPAIKLETAEGALIRYAGNEGQMEKAAIGVLAPGRLWSPGLRLAPRLSPSI
jgi:hypothetical protein